MLFLDTDTLKSVRERPQMYFGSSPFIALCHYYQGCEHTWLLIDPQSPAHVELAGFEQWVCERFQTALPSFRWWQIIWERAPDDRSQVQMFVDLFLEYRASRSDAAAIEGLKG